MKYIFLIVACVVLCCACEREVPAVNDDGTMAVNDTLASSGGGANITIKNDGQWGGVNEQ